MRTQTTEIPSNDLPDPPDARKCREALATVRAELLALPASRVAQPDEDVAAFAQHVLAWRAARASASAGREVSHRVEVLALALSRAHHELALQPSTKDLRDLGALAASAERAFAVLQENVETLERRGQLGRHHVRPLARLARARTRDERCLRIVDLVDAFRVEPHEDMPRSPRYRAEKLALELYSAGQAEQHAVTRPERRDRAYSALRSAFDAAQADEQHAEPKSGVFTTASLFDASAPRAVANAG